MTDNLKLWDSVSKTNPANTKQVSQRGGFTAINANSQIMEATRAFGPIGIGWGYTNGNPIFEAGMIIIPVTLWHGKRDNVFGPVYGAEEIAPRGKIDTDAPKKAATDGLTKCLSHLGFNADVFLGMYDDQKYVAELKKEFAPREPSIDDAQWSIIVTMLQAANVTTAQLVASEKVGSFSEIPASRYDAIVKKIQLTIDKNEKEGNDQ